jgi:hypothetical protein
MHVLGIICRRRHFLDRCRPTDAGNAVGAYVNRQVGPSGKRSSVSRDDALRRAEQRLQERAGLSPFEARRLADELVRDFDETLQSSPPTSGETEETRPDLAGWQWFWIVCELAVLAILIIAGVEYLGVLG